MDIISFDMEGNERPSEMMYVISGGFKRLNKTVIIVVYERVL
jgi:hypothetical protein